MGEEFLSPMKPSSSYPPSNVFNNAIVASEASAAPGKTRLPLFVRFKTFVFDQSSRLKRFCSRNPDKNINHEGPLSTLNIEVPKITSFAVKGVVPKSVVVQEQSTSPDVKKETVPIVASQAQNTPSGVKDNNDPSSVVVHAQDTPSRVDDSTKSQSAAVALQAAREDARKFKTLGGHAINVISAVRDGPADLDTASSFQDTYLQPLRIFDSAIRNIAEMHPYAKIALSVLSCASKIVLDQVDLDGAVYCLVEKLADVYEFMNEDETLDQISSMHSIVSKLSQQTLECAHFIRDYSSTKGFWKRLGKNVVSETNSTIQMYTNKLEALMQNFRDRVDREVVIFVHHIADELNLNEMTYAKGAALDIGKQCLPGTREDIISQIMTWIDKSGDSAGRVLWLSGTAGTGKTAIAHTIASKFIGVGELGSCYCFDCHSADLRHEKVFSTIARDLADRHPQMRQALSSAVQNDNALKNTADIIQQWDKLLTKPLEKLSESIVGPIVIVIDALDESGSPKTRSTLLRILSGKLQNPGVLEITKLPSNFRFIVTSRPLHDIDAEFADVQHIQQMSMDDIPPGAAEHDIRTYVSKKLEGLSNFGETEFKALAEKAAGIFEWARLACEAITEPPPGYSANESFDAVASRDPTKRRHLLYDIYRLLLKRFTQMDEDNAAIQLTQLRRFRSVMGQILGAPEPLPMASLNAMRSEFPNQENFKVEIVVKHMGSLLSGTTGALTPVRPLHATFRDFLTDKAHSREFFVDISKVQHSLAFASLRVMELGLSFNICDLKTSYLPNSMDTGLQERVDEKIPPHLSYACRFWATHVKDTDFHTLLAKKVRSFLRHEQLLFWLEALSLINALNSAGCALSLIVPWLEGHSGYEDVLSTTMDVQRFVQIFGNIILHSTPHLYVSALPFSPINSIIYKKFAAKFPKTLCLAAECANKDWPAVQSVLRGHTQAVLSVSFSPDGGTRIVTCSEDMTVRLWDAATRQPIGQPWQGHTGSINSAAFSPDGTRVVTGSSDKTVRLWDTTKGQPIGKPWQGHTGSVNSVSFSPEGTHVATGSSDHTVRLWHAATGKPDGEPWKGHNDSVNSVSFSPDGTRIMSGSSDRTIRLWNAVTRQPVAELMEDHTDSVISVSFSPDGTCIATGSQDFTTRQWDAMGKIVGQPFLGHTRSVNSVSFSPDSSRIVTGSSDNTVRLWDVETRKQVGQHWEHTSSVKSVSFSPDGTHIVTGSSDGTVWLWDVAMMQPACQSLWEHTRYVSSVSFSPNGTHIATGSLDTGIVRLWNAVTGQLVGEPLVGHKSSVRSLSFSPDGTHIVTGSWDETVRLWDVETRQQVGDAWCGHKGSVNSVSFSPNGTHVVTGSSDKTVRMWDVEMGKQVGQYWEHYGPVNAVSFSPNGTHVVTGSSDTTVRLWDAAGQAVGKPWRGHRGSVTSLSFSPDGTRVLTGSLDKTVRLWDIATGKQIGKPLQEGTCSVNSVSFSSDGIHVVTGSSDHTIRLWGAAKDQLVQVGEPLRGHTGSVNSVSFSPDGTRIVSCSADGTIRLWYAGDIHLPERFVNFSSNSSHTLCNTAELIPNTSHDDPGSTTFLLRDDGWLVGPNNRLLFWVPPASRPAFYSPWNALVIPGNVELDLSRMAHGSRWQDCRGPTRRTTKERLLSLDSSG